jgi:hypothetical protein
MGACILYKFLYMYYRVKKARSILTTQLLITDLSYRSQLARGVKLKCSALLAYCPTYKHKLNHKNYLLESFSGFLSTPPQLSVHCSFKTLHADLDLESGDGSAVGDGVPAPHRVRTLRLKAP